MTQSTTEVLTLEHQPIVTKLVEEPIVVTLDHQPIVVELT